MTKKRSLPMTEGDKQFIRGYCCAMTVMEGIPGFYAASVERAAKEAGITLARAKKAGVEEFDLKTLRAAGVR